MIDRVSVEWCCPSPPHGEGGESSSEKALVSQSPQSPLGSPLLSHPQGAVQEVPLPGGSRNSLLRERRGLAAPAPTPPAHPRCTKLTQTPGTTPGAAHLDTPTGHNARCAGRTIGIKVARGVKLGKWHGTSVPARLGVSHGTCCPFRAPGATAGSVPPLTGRLQAKAPVAFAQTSTDAPAPPRANRAK